VIFWAQGERWKNLEFMVNGAATPYKETIWQSDTSEQHLQRLIEWCSSQKYACIHVPYTRAHKNISPWHVEMVVIPELQPLYFTEDTPHIYGKRLKKVPQLFGLTPREQPFTELPHPFA
jgi:hypothetical protein